MTTNDQRLADLGAMGEQQILAMGALFEFSDAVSGNMTINDLKEVMALAIEDGHDMMKIQLCMALQALEMVRKERAAELAR